MYRYGEKSLSCFRTLAVFKKKKKKKINSYVHLNCHQCFGAISVKAESRAGHSPPVNHRLGRATSV